MPHELMGNNYAGPARLIPMAQLPNTAGYEFTGIDKSGGEHDCAVQIGCDGLHHVNCKMAHYEELIGWIPKQ
jgi:hypothetical protein